MYQRTGGQVNSILRTRPHLKAWARAGRFLKMDRSGGETWQKLGDGSRRSLRAGHPGAVVGPESARNPSMFLSDVGAM